MAEEEIVLAGWPVAKLEASQQDKRSRCVHTRTWQPFLLAGPLIVRRLIPGRVTLAALAMSAFTFCQETNVDVRPPLPRQVLLEAAIPRWKDQVFFLETVEVYCMECRPLWLEELRESPLPCAYTVLHEWMMAAEPIPKTLLRKVLAHLLVVPSHCFSLFFDADTRCATVVFEPDALTPTTCIEKIESPSLRCDTCDAWLDANHQHVIKPGDFGTEYFYEMQGLPHWIGIPGYVSLCCLCYHTAAYCRTRWSAHPGLQEDPVKSRELERWLRLRVPISNLDDLASLWPEFHGHCLAYHGMLRSRQGLQLADQYSVRLINWDLWHRHRVRVWERDDIQAWIRLPASAVSGQERQAAHGGPSEPQLDAPEVDGTYT